MNFLKKLFSSKKSLFNKEGMIVKTAFTIGGIEYLEVDNILGLPYDRGMQAVHVYEEVRMKCDYDFLKAHCTAINNIFEGKKIGFEEITKMKKLNDQLLERLNKIIDTDLVYKLAAVVFFDRNESPYEYDEQYARKKIAHWKKHADAHSFFLQEPLQRLIPFLKQPEVDFRSYSEMIDKINRIHWAPVFDLLTTEQKKLFAVKNDSYAVETPQESLN